MSPPVLLNPYLFGGGGGGSYADAVIADGAGGYWKEGEASGTTLVDSSGGSHDGTYNGPTLGQTSLLTSDPTTCALYDASNDRAEVTYGAWMDAPTALTVEAWVNTGGTTLTGQVRPILDRDHSSGRVFQWRINNGQINFIKIGGTGGIVTATSVASLSSNTTYYLAATYDGSNIRLYIDGVINGSPTAASGTLGTGNSPLVLGATYGGTSSLTNFYGGRHAHAAIYPGVVLSGTEIADHFALAS